MALPRIAKLTLCAVLLVAPFALVVKAQAVLAESAAKQSVATLVALTAPLAAPAAEPGAGDEGEPAVEVAATVTTPLAAGKSQSGAKRGAATAPASKPPALFVSAQSVLRLSRSAAQPSGTYVARSDQHPAGIRLVGVGALGIGVQDGDILIDAMGIPARARNEIVGAVIEARARRVKALSGTLWRAGQTFTITVEQPYLDPA